MNLLILFVGIIIGILISGTIFTITIHNEKQNAVDDMKSYINELERENVDLKERNRRLKEALRKT